jgi:RNA polymerase sigma factor (sigma-70 family)
VKQNQYSHKTDSELLAAFYAAGNNEILGILLQRYTMLLLGTCIKYLKNEELAKDAVQQIFFQVLNELPKHEIIYFKSWLYMVAKNHCLMQLRAKGIKSFNELDESNLQADDSTIFSAIEKEQLLQMTEHALPELNEEQKICITLFYLEKKTYNEVCTTTGFSLLQVKSFIQNGKRNLKKIVEKKMKEKYG